MFRRIRQFKLYLKGRNAFKNAQRMEQKVDRAVRSMVPYDLSAKRRIVYAHLYGVVEISGRYYALDRHGLPMPSGAMTPEEFYLHRQRVDALAAFRELAQADFAEWHMLTAPNGFAGTGYQQLNRGNPIISAVGRDGKLNELAMRKQAERMDPGMIKGLDPDVLEWALDGYGDEQLERVALLVLRYIDEVRLGNAADASHRHSFSTARKTDLLYRIALENRLVEAAEAAKHEFTNDDAWRAHIDDQLRKQQLIIERYQRIRNEFFRDHPADS